MDQEGWEKLGACGAKERYRGFEGAPPRSTFTAKDPVEMPEDMAFQEEADPPSENWDLGHPGIGTFMPVAIFGAQKP